MKKLYEKNELTFSIICIVAYVILFSNADKISKDLGTVKIITAPLAAAFSAFLFIWVKKNGLAEKLGLCKPKVSAGRFLYYIPLIILSSTNLWRGVTLNFSVLESVLYVISMLCAGFLEELIFRGFLFKALCKDNVKSAIVISGVTFGIGHIVNLLNGAEVLSTLLQMCYAVAIGLLFTVIFYKSKSIIPCIISHSVINSLSTFGAESSDIFNITVAAVMTLVSLAYSAFILKINPQENNS